MSTLKIDVTTVDKVLPHENADSLEILHIKGWQCVVRKNSFQQGETVVYIPPDSVIPQEHSDRWGITKYLTKGRVRCAKLRGQPSFGVIVKNEGMWDIGTDVTQHYGITKYEPPINYTIGLVEKEHVLFDKYTEIENLRNYPTAFDVGEEVVATEKIHGTNSRVAVIDGVEMAGSRRLQRKKSEDGTPNTYWYPLTLQCVNDLLHSYKENSVILYGEIYGSQIQNLDYGKTKDVGYIAFDLRVNGQFLSYDDFVNACEKYNVPVAPLLYRGPYSLDRIKSVSEGQTTLNANHIREGVVVKPTTERRDPKYGRVIFKYINDEYLLAKNISDTTDA